MHPNRSPLSGAGRQVRSSPGFGRGFSLIELSVAFLILVGLFSAILTLFDVNNRVAKTQAYVSEMQQSLRNAQYGMVRTVRMAGRGGLPRGQLPGGFGVAVRNEVPESGDEHFIALADTDSPEIVPGTDVLTVRGVLSTPLYQMNPAAGMFQLDSLIAPTSGTVRLQDPNPSTGVPQDLRPLADVVDLDLPEAIVIVSQLADEIYAVVELNADASSVNETDDDGNPIDITLAFKVVGGTNTQGYLSLTPGGTFPVGLRGVSFLGILEEYRFYVREEHSIPGDDSSDLMPRLSRARFYPGTQLPHAGDPVNLGNDIADGIVDLQIAFGIDTDRDGTVAEDLETPSADEWLFNDDGDNPEEARWNSGTFPPGLHFVRITTLARTARPDTRFVSSPITALEDHEYAESELPSLDSELANRRFRRRSLQTMVEMRNL